MNTKYKIFIFIALSVFAFSCGNKKPKPNAGDKTKSGAHGTTETSEDMSKETAQANKGIADWLGKEASAKVSAAAGDLARKVGLNIAMDEKVMAELKKLIGAIFKDKNVKQKTDKIADKATSGFGNKVKLGWKALSAGGVKAYKAKVKATTNRVGQEVISEHIKEKVLKDPRMVVVIKNITPALQLQGKIATASLQENLSPRVAQKLFGIALKLSVAGESDKTTTKVEAWTTSCNGHVEDEVEKLFKKMASLQSFKKAMSELTIDVIGHKRTTKELSSMMINIMKNKEAYNAMVKAYEASAFDKGEKKIRAAIEKIVNMSIVNDELFATLETLAAAEGAGSVMESHFVKVGEDPELAKLVDEFIINLLVTCGDPIN